jgi:hypothetical protein
VSAVISPFQVHCVASRIQSILRLILLKNDQIIEYRHHRILSRVKRFLKNRHARWTVMQIDLENATRLFGVCRNGREEGS